jgi:hypothetical protein
MEDDKKGDASSLSFAPLQVPGGLAISVSEKAEAIYGRQPWGSGSAGERPVEPGSSWDGFLAMRACVYTPAC